VIKVSVLYPNTAGCKFDMSYYLNQHIAMKHVLAQDGWHRPLGAAAGAQELQTTPNSP
jgi:hypothetical protein